MSPAGVDSTMPEIVSEASSGCNRFDGLRSVRWRINLGILPSPASSNDELRRVTADSRRRYAGLRRHLLVDPHVSKNGSYSPNLVMDNPLSQNPDSTWGRFFRNAELEKMVEQDLSRLYPEHGSYFQTLGCQGMLRRILLLWCLRHPDCGYRQGMHELLAPLLYVLQVDLERLSQVRNLYEDLFADKFDGLSFHENDLTYNFDLKKLPDSTEDDIGSEGNGVKISSLDELDPEIQIIVLLSDAYGAEGELGIVLSEKFMEHDAYCMFDALMSGSHGSVAMADFFSPPPGNGSFNLLPPVIEASAALYHLLSVVDSSLHNHLVELGVEPQYFALRWLRVLFGREFSLEDLLIIWDEIFAADNGKSDKSAGDDVAPRFRVLQSPRGAFISAIAVSIILYLRSSLLATENATYCLQRLLNLPKNVNLKKLIEKAKSLQVLALSTNISSPSLLLTGDSNQSKTLVLRGHSLSSDSISPKTPLSLVPESYWEEKWRVLQKEEELKKGSPGNSVSTRKKRWTEKVRLRLSRTESDPLPAKILSGEKDIKTPVRRSLLEDLSQKCGSEEHKVKVGCHEVMDKNSDFSIEAEVEGQESSKEDHTCRTEESCLSGNAGSEENMSMFSDQTSLRSEANDHENETEKSSVASNLSLDDNDDHSQIMTVDSPLPVSFPHEEVYLKSGCNNDSPGKSVTGPVLKERKLLSGKLLWFWKFGRSVDAEGPAEKGKGSLENTKSANCESSQNSATGSSSTKGSYGSFSSKGDGVDQNVMSTLRNLGHSMIEHIQVIESVFQQDRGQVGSLDNFSKNVIVGKGQVKAMEALKELRQISNILSEM